MDAREQEILKSFQGRPIPHQVVKTADGTEHLQCLDLTHLPGALRSEFDAQGFYIRKGAQALSVEEVSAAPSEIEALPGLEPLPEDFPNRSILAEAGITTFAQLQAVEDLDALPGIGEARAEQIKAALTA